jgi:hypothetical protein
MASDEIKLLMRKLKNQRNEVSGCQIQYLIIDDQESIVQNEFYCTAFDFLRRLPKSLIQFVDPEHYFIFTNGVNALLGHNIFEASSEIIKRENGVQTLLTYISYFNKDIVRVLIINGDIDREAHIKVQELIDRMPIAYYFIIDGESEVIEEIYHSDNRIRDEEDLISYLKRDWSRINDLLFEFRGDRLPDKFTHYNWISNPNYQFNVSQSNHFILNQIIGNNWHGNLEDKEAPTDKRIAQLISQIESIDTCYKTFRKIGYPTPIDPLNQPIILLAPFHSPVARQMYSARTQTRDEKRILKLYSSEQDIDYRISIAYEQEPSPDEENVTKVVLYKLSQDLKFLDCLGFLHASFTSSPVLRLPIIGQSINTDLSHLFGTFKNKVAAVRKIRKIGGIIKEKMLRDEFSELLKSRNGQIVAISDLPIEWVSLDGTFPLSFTHDVCRIPQFNINALANNYIQHTRNNFSIKNSILSKTLVIQCASERDVNMIQHFKYLEPLQAQLGFTLVKCKTVEEIKNAVDKYDPDLLIFDCHGNYDRQKSESYLVIDAENRVFLKGEDIVENEITAPLVFISACSTHPNYGFSKHLTDAFCEAGAHSVTATYLPIAMNEATIIIGRLLNNLRFLPDDVMHNNWLSFIGHLFRSAAVFEMLNKLRKNGKIGKYDASKIGRIISNLLLFHKRTSVFEEIITYLQKENPDLKVDFSLLDNEWLSYTTIGRPDLLFFENWEVKNTELYSNAAKG